MAGQINGTTGYEEAGGQGILAGINAGRKSLGKETVTLDRSTSYIGVMIDDIVLRGTSEPYRVFTSRSEYRLTIRADNADVRLTPLGIEFGCVGRERQNFFLNKMENYKQAEEYFLSQKISPSELAKKGYNISQDGIIRSAYELLGHPLFGAAEVKKIFDLSNYNDKITRYLEVESKYSSYLERQRQDIEIFKQEESLKIPEGFDYSKISSLSNEVREKLTRNSPPTIRAASLIQGVTPAAITALIIYLKTSNLTSNEF